MASISHITASEITDLTTLYIDGKQGTVLAAEYNDSTETTFVTFEDANGEHTIQLAADDTVPVLS